MIKHELTIPQLPDYLPTYFDKKWHERAVAAWDSNDFSAMGLLAAELEAISAQELEKEKFRQMEDSFWLQTRKMHSIAGYHAYINSSNRTEDHVQEALTFINELYGQLDRNLWEEAKKINQIQSYTDYINKSDVPCEYKKFIEAAENARADLYDDADWTSATLENSLISYQNYIDKHDSGKGKYLATARKRNSELEWQTINIDSLNRQQLHGYLAKICNYEQLPNTTVEAVTRLDMMDWSYVNDFTLDESIENFYNKIELIRAYLAGPERPEFINEDLWIKLGANIRGKRKTAVDEIRRLDSLVWAKIHETIMSQITAPDAQLLVLLDTYVAALGKEARHVADAEQTRAKLGAELKSIKDDNKTWQNCLSLKDKSSIAYYLRSIVDKKIQGRYEPDALQLLDDIDWAEASSKLPDGTIRKLYIRYTELKKYLNGPSAQLPSGKDWNIPRAHAVEAKIELQNIDNEIWARINHEISNSSMPLTEKVGLLENYQSILNISGIYIEEVKNRLNDLLDAAPTSSDSPTEETIRRQQTNTEQAKQEQAKQEQAKQEQAKQEQAKQEQAKQEQAKQEQAKQEQAEQEQAKQEQAKQEQAKQEQAEQEQAKLEQAEQEQAEQEQAEQEQAKQERAKQEQTPAIIIQQAWEDLSIQKMLESLKFDLYLWDHAEKEGTDKSYERYLRHSPVGRMRLLSACRIDEFHWKVAITNNTKDSIKRYIERPFARHYQEAMNRLEIVGTAKHELVSIYNTTRNSTVINDQRILFEEADSLNTVTALRRFAWDNPLISNGIAARRKIEEMLWNAAVSTNSSKSWMEYLCSEPPEQPVFPGDPCPADPEADQDIIDHICEAKDTILLIEGRDDFLRNELEKVLSSLNI